MRPCSLAMCRFFREVLVTYFPQHCDFLCENRVLECGKRLSVQRYESCTSSKGSASPYNTHETMCMI